MKRSSSVSTKARCPGMQERTMSIASSDDLLETFDEREFFLIEREVFGDCEDDASVPSRKYVHIVAGLWQRSNPPWRSRRRAAHGCLKLERIDRFSRPVP